MSLVCLYTVFIMTNEHGRVQNFREYADRMVLEEEGDSLVEALKEVAQKCPHGSPEDEARDTSKDLSVFPPSPLMISLVCNVLVASKVRDRYVRTN